MFLCYTKDTPKNTNIKTNCIVLSCLVVNRQWFHSARLGKDSTNFTNLDANLDSSFLNKSTGYTKGTDTLIDT